MKLLWVYFAHILLNILISLKIIKLFLMILQIQIRLLVWKLILINSIKINNILFEFILSRRMNLTCQIAIDFACYHTWKRLSIVIFWVNVRWGNCRLTYVHSILIYWFLRLSVIFFIKINCNLKTILIFLFVAEIKFSLKLNRLLIRSKFGFMPSKCPIATSITAWEEDLCFVLYLIIRHLINSISQFSIILK